MIWNVLFALAAVYITRRACIRLRLSKAKHPSIRGHAKMSRRIARLLPFYSYQDNEVFSIDGAPETICRQREQAFLRLSESLKAQSTLTLEKGASLQQDIADVEFTNSYRVPFQFRRYVSQHMLTGLLADASDGVQIRDLDGNWSYDLTGAYGVNLYGYDFYKQCISEGARRVEELGPALGPYHPVIVPVVERLKRISGKDQVSFHMSGTEAVMQAVRLAHYHTRKSKTVVFCGAYHGWWDGVQPGVGSQRKVSDVYTLKEMDKDTLRVLATRKDIACVLVNPLQALNPNGSPSSDSMLIASDRSAHYDREAYTHWLKQLRQVCTEKGIVLIFDEVFLGFRLALGGAQEYFGVQADMVTYGKTLGGGLPVGVVCGRKALMKRYRADKPADVCFARGTFNSHPYVLGAMWEFLERIESDKFQIDYEMVDAKWNRRAAEMNRALAAAGLPLQVKNMSSIFVLIYTLPSRYNWLLQYYLRESGLLLAWIGTGRFIFSHNYSDAEFGEITKRIVVAGEHMLADGWWWESGRLNNKSIKKTVARELIGQLFRGSAKASGKNALDLSK